MGHAGDSDELFEVACDELGSVVGDDAGFGIGVFFAGALQEDFDLRLGHRLVNLEVDDGTAVAIKDAGQVVKSSADIDVGDVDVPVVVGLDGMLESGSLG